MNIQDPHIKYFLLILSELTSKDLWCDLIIEKKERCDIAVNKDGDVRSGK